MSGTALAWRHTKSRPSGPVYALNIPTGTWHTLLSLESGTVILEMKDGPDDPIGAEDVLG